MSKKDEHERRRVFERQEQIRIDDLFHGKTLEEVAEEIRSMSSGYEKEAFNQDKQIKFKVERLTYDRGECLYLEVWRWETDAEMARRQERERAAEEKRRRRSETAKAAAALRKQKKSEKEYAEYQRLRAKFGDL